MAFVHSFAGVTPPARYDAIPWTQVRVQESILEVGPFTTIQTLAIPIDPTPDTPNSISVTTNAATLENGWFRFQFLDAAAQTSPYSAATFSPSLLGAEALITLSEYKTYKGIDPTDNRDDTKLNLSIAYASRAVINYAERDFGAINITEQRTFEYDGSGFLDIDDALALTLVKQVVPNGTDLTLNADQWYALPPTRDDSPVFYYVALPGYSSKFAFSPEMGFVRNLDVYAAEGRLHGTQQLFKVTGTWGWPVVPDDVKLATIWTVDDWVNRQSGDNLTSEAIEGYARGWAPDVSGMPALGVPNRARDLLARYQKVNV